MYAVQYRHRYVRIDSYYKPVNLRGNKGKGLEFGWCSLCISKVVLRAAIILELFVTCCYYLLMKVLIHCLGMLPRLILLY